jgi:hypothetical protein
VVAEYSLHVASEGTNSGQHARDKAMNLRSEPAAAGAMNRVGRLFATTYAVRLFLPFPPISRRQRVAKIAVLRLNAPAAQQIK